MSFRRPRWKRCARSDNLLDDWASSDNPIQVCEIYFRILKDAAAPEHFSGRPLLGETFAGLARVAHLIDYEVVADILEVRPTSLVIDAWR